MGLWKRIWGKEEVRAEGATDEKGNAALLRSLTNTQELTREDILAIPDVEFCMGLIAETIAGLPIKLYRKHEDELKEVEDDLRLYLLNYDTKDTLTATQFWRAMIEDYYLGRGGFAYINKRLNHIESLHYVEGMSVSILKNSDPIFKDYNISVMGKTYFPFEFFKILRRTKDGCTQENIVSKIVFAVAYSQLKYQKGMLTKGGNKKGFLRSENVLSDATITSLKEAMRNLYQNDSENIVVLNKGIDFKESSNTSVEMELDENMKTTGSLVCKVFGLPSSIRTDADEKQFVRCVARVIQDIEASLNRDLLLENEKGNTYFAYDTRDLSRGDIEKRYKAYLDALRGNFMQIDEVRKLEDMDPLGINWITLGLDQVLYNPDTNEVYTPNTNRTALMNNLKGGIDIESGNQE